MSGKPNPFPSSEYALLGFLNRGPCHGYELHKKLVEPNGIGMVWGVKIANMYAQLEKMEQKGWISGHLTRNDQRPARTEYSLTPAGSAEFNSWLTRLVEHPREFRHEFMTRVYFLLMLHPEKLPETVGKQMHICERWLMETETKKQALSQPGTFENVTFHFRVSQIQSMVDWLRWLNTQILNIHNEGVKE